MFNWLAYLQKDKSGRTALHWAAISGHSAIVQLLLDKGADILAETTSKTNALHSAVEANRLDTVKVLMGAVVGDEIKKTALTMGKNSDDKTPWEIALAAKNTPICQALKEMGDVNGASSACTIS
jgi:ankyrin repeat protein